jgi:hypothetical protein
MIEVLRQHGSTIATAITTGSLIFIAGKESGRLDEVVRKVYAAEVERKSIQEVVYDVHGRICSMEQDIKYIKNRKP